QSHKVCVPARGVVRAARSILPETANAQSNDTLLPAIRGAVRCHSAIRVSCRLGSVHTSIPPSPPPPPSGDSDSIAPLPPSPVCPRPAPARVQREIQACVSCCHPAQDLFD